MCLLRVGGGVKKATSGSLAIFFQGEVKRCQSSNPSSADH